MRESTIRHEPAPLPPAPSILLVDDDAELGHLMRAYFAQQGFSLESVADGTRGLAATLSGRYDLVLLDVMMPGLDGFELLRLLRRQSEIPVIMLTARTAPDDRINGLDAGADDYLPKPFAPGELLARVRAVLRRAGRVPPPVESLSSGAIALSPTAREARCDGIPLTLTTSEFDILEHLVRAAGRVVSRDELSGAVYHRRASPFDRALDVHVSNLRRKLGSHGSVIRTVRAVGYLFASGGEPAEEL